MRAVVAAVLVAVGLVGVAPGSAFAAETCDAGPVELVATDFTHTVAGTDVIVGYLLRRRATASGPACVVSGATVRVHARNIGETEPRVVRSGVTDPNGRVQFRLSPPFHVVLTGVSDATPGHPSATSRLTTIRVATRLPTTVSRSGACHLLMTGRTYPAKPGNVISIYRAGRYARRLTSVRTGSAGGFRARVAVACGTSPRLVAVIGQTYRNDGGSSEYPEPVANPVRVCGRQSPEAAPGPVASGLTVRLELFNTRVVVGGEFAGEVVVTNEAAEPRSVTFDGGYADWHDVLLRPASTEVVGVDGGSDALVGSQPRTLAPGAELRSLIRFDSGNCLTQEEGGYFVIPPGRPLPPDRYDAVVHRSVDHGREWYSPRVPVEVVR